MTTKVNSYGWKALLGSAVGYAMDGFDLLILGFGITEVYIMASGWAFIIPIAYGYLMKGLSHRHRQILRGMLLVITIFLWVYNGGLTANYLLNL